MNNLNIMGFMATMAIGLAAPSADAESFEFHQPIGGLRAAENTANDAMALTSKRSITTTFLAMAIRAHPCFLAKRHTKKQTHLIWMWRLFRWMMLEITPA